jgi:hypothetical protein
MRQKRERLLEVGDDVVLALDPDRQVPVLTRWATSMSSE